MEIHTFWLILVAAIAIKADDETHTCVFSIQQKMTFADCSQQLFTNDTAMTAVMSLVYKDATNIDSIIAAIRKTGPVDTLRLSTVASNMLNNGSWQAGTAHPVHRLQVAELCWTLQNNPIYSQEQKKMAEDIVMSQKQHANDEIQKELSTNSQASIFKVTGLLQIAYSKIQTKSILKIVRNARMEHTQKVSAYVYIFWFLKKDSKLRTADSLILAHDLRNAEVDPQFGTVASQVKTAFRAAKEDLPTSIRNIAFASSVKIHLQERAMLNVYLTAASESIDKYRRPVNADPDGNSRRAAWELERTDEDSNTYYIKNVQQDEYLFSSVLDYDQDRRRLFTWTNGNKLARGLFYLIPVAENVYIQSVSDNEYMVADKPFGNSSQVLVSTRRNFTKYYTKWGHPSSEAAEKPIDRWRIEAF